MAPARKLRLALLYGGRSSEHEVSLQSARNILEALDRDKYEVRLIAIGKDGRWGPALPAPPSLPPGPGLPALPGRASDASDITAITDGEAGPLPARALTGDLDVVFPVLHGPFGEDGSVQGLLKLADLPFVGPDVLASAVGMDKDMAKRLLRDAAIPVAEYLVFHRHQAASLEFPAIAARLGLPFFVKPANQGSSVGVSKVRDQGDFAGACAGAFRWDRKILMEKAITGREIEVAVLGNENPEASVPGEVIPTGDFYSYAAKYVDPDGAELRVPADLPAPAADAVRDLALRAFRALDCEGMARVDFFYTPAGEFLVNEVNTIPGFTRNSMYPKLWEASGLPYPRLLDRLVELALERHARDRAIGRTG